MNKNLYFIKYLAEALDAPDPREGLKKAHAEIGRLGELPEYRKGFEQYLRFLSVAAEHLEGLDISEDPDMVRQGIMKFINVDPDLRLPEILVEHHGDVIGSFAARKPGRFGVLEGVTPGVYLVRLDTGRRLWEGELGRQDLLWREAFPQEALLLAADTEDGTQRVSREIGLLGKDVIIRVIPGRNSGRLEFFLER